MKWQTKYVGIKSIQCFIIFEIIYSELMDFPQNGPFKHGN